MKKILAIILVCTFVFSLTACTSTSISVNVGNSDQLSGNKFGKAAMVWIGDGLYYDSTTRIVYWWNGIISSSYSATTPSPYYAPNGLPYRYNPETNTFEEIENETA